MTAELRPVGVLLAGGLARRMGGGDKALRRLGGRTLLDHVVAAVAPQCRALVLNANGPPERFAGCGLPVVADPVAGHPGPLAGVLAGMRWAAAQYPDAADVLSVPADTLFLPGDLVARLLEARRRDGGAIACAASGGRVHPAVALWPVVLAEALEAALRSGVRRVGDWARGQGLALAVFDDAGTDPFFNVNSAEDLAAAERLLRGG